LLLERKDSIMYGNSAKFSWMNLGDHTEPWWSLCCNRWNYFPTSWICTRHISLTTWLLGSLHRCITQLHKFRSREPISGARVKQHLQDYVHPLQWGL
jgi:hypothetical protein